MKLLSDTLHLSTWLEYKNLKVLSILFSGEGTGAPTHRNSINNDGEGYISLHKTIPGFDIGDNDGSNVAITMALTNYQRQKKWRDKNRAIYNLQRRNRRKNLHINKTPDEPAVPVSKVEELRTLMEKASKEPSAAVNPLIYRDDYGRIINQRQWNTLQNRKSKAKAGGYEIDEYTQ